MNFSVMKFPGISRNIKSEIRRVFMGHDPHTKIPFRRHVVNEYKICADKEFPRSLTQQFKTLRHEGILGQWDKLVQPKHYT